MRDFYTRFYAAVATSAANAAYCTRVYGRNLCQHGFAQRYVGGDQPDTGAHVMLCLRQQVSGDHFGIAGVIGKDIDL